MFQKGALFKFVEGLPELGLRFHDDRAIPRHGFLERLSGDQQEADAGLTALDHDFVALIEQHQRAVMLFQKLFSAFLTTAAL